MPCPGQLEPDEIPEASSRFSPRRQNAKAAGFDGVELHGANGVSD